jgi:hypothetical protein
MAAEATTTQSGVVKTCPYCGAADGDAADRPDPRRQALEALHREVARIREIAEQQSPEQEIARLTHEVQLLRETVARLRGTTRNREPISL